MKPGVDKSGQTKAILPESLKIIDGPAAIQNGHVVVTNGTSGTTTATFEVCAADIVASEGVSEVETLTLANPGHFRRRQEEPGLHPELRRRGDVADLDARQPVLGDSPDVATRGHRGLDRLAAAPRGLAARVSPGELHRPRRGNDPVGASKPSRTSERGTSRSPRPRRSSTPSSSSAPSPRRTSPRSRSRSTSRCSHRSGSRTSSERPRAWRPIPMRPPDRPLTSSVPRLGTRGSSRASTSGWTSSSPQGSASGLPRQPRRQRTHRQPDGPVREGARADDHDRRRGSEHRQGLFAGRDRGVGARGFGHRSHRWLWRRRRRRRTPRCIAGLHRLITRVVLTT